MIIYIYISVAILAQGHVGSFQLAGPFAESALTGAHSFQALLAFLLFAIPLEDRLLFFCSCTCIG